MSEYDIGFGRKLAEIAAEVEAKDPDRNDARRTIVYLSRLSTEIALKALLERAGVPVAVIRRCSHRLSELLTELGKCEIEFEIAPGFSVQVA